MEGKTRSMCMTRCFATFDILVSKLSVRYPTPQRCEVFFFPTRQQSTSSTLHTAHPVSVHISLSRYEYYGSAYCSNQDQICLIKIRECVGFCDGSWLLGSSVIGDLKVDRVLVNHLDAIIAVVRSCPRAVSPRFGPANMCAMSRVHTRAYRSYATDVLKIVQII